MNKILYFKPPVITTQKPSSSSLVQEQRLAMVHELINPWPVFHIYEERLMSGDVAARDFFTVLVRSGAVTIVNEGGCICLESVLIVKQGENIFHRMKVTDFIHLTEPTPGMVQEENIDSYLIPILSSIGTKIGMIEAEDIVSESVMGKEDADIFHAENIKAVWDKGYYACCINNLDGEGMDYTLDDFASPKDTPLLHLICHAYYRYFGSGCIVDEERIQIELDRCEGINIDSTQISISLFQEIILSAIDRKYPLYSNYVPDKRIKKFYDDVVYPLLSKKYLNGEFKED